MFIPDDLPQFADKKTLIIVSSTQSADLHIAHESEVATVTEVRTENLEHYDQPGQFQRSKAGKTLGTGGSVRDQAPKLKNKFHRDLGDALDKIDIDEIQQVILLSSPQDKEDTKEQLPKQLADLITVEIDGNYVGDHPKEIMQRIAEAV